MEEYNSCPGWFMVPRVCNTVDEITVEPNVNATNESNCDRSPDKQSSSSIEVLSEDEETLKDTPENLAEIQNIEDDEENQISAEHLVENNSGNQDSADLETLFPQLFTENSVTTQLIETFRNETPLRTVKKVIKRKATDSGNHKVKKIRIKNVDKLLSQHLQDLMTFFVCLAGILYLVNAFSSKGSNSHIIDAIAELKEENKLIKEEFSNYIKNERSRRDFFLQEIVVTIRQHFPDRKEFDDLREQVKNASDSQNLQDQILGHFAQKDSKLSFGERNTLSSHLEKFSDIVSTLHKELYPENDKSQDDDPCTVFSFKPSNFSKIIMNRAESFKKILKDLQNEDLTTVISTQISALKSFGYKGVTFMKNAFQCIDKKLTPELGPESEIKKNLKKFREILAKWKQRTN